VLGMRIARDRAARTLKLDQQVYAEKVLEQFGMKDCNPAATPQEERPAKAGHEAVDESSDDAGWRQHYGTAVGIFLYLALSTRPDMAHAASVRARAVSNPTYADWLACKRVFRYLKGTASMGLTFGGIRGSSSTSSGTGGQGVILAPAFCDADWAGDTTDRRSTTGFIIKVNGSPVSWTSKKQTTVSLSSAEAEYMAAGAAAQEVMWMRALMEELGFVQREATVLQSDNQSAIAIASDDVHHARTKHIDIRHHFIREHIVAGTMRLQWVPSADQEADILTKPLGRVLFCKLRDRVLGMSC
jgi:hypothetical protein